MSKVDKVQKLVQKGKVADLVKLTKDKDQAVRLAAIARLGETGKDEACNELISMLTDQDAEIRASAAAALGTLGNSHAQTYLRYHMEHEKDSRVAQAIKDGISKLNQK